MPQSEDARRFADIPFLANLDDSALDSLAFASETKILRRGERLFSRGEPAPCAFVLITGRLILSDGDGAGSVEVRPGSLIGEMALLIDAERRSNADALEPSAVLQVTRDSFMRVLKNNPASAIKLRDFCARRLAAFTEGLGAAADAVASEDEA